MLDGELVAFDDAGRPDFPLVCEAVLHRRGSIPRELVAFDVLSIAPSVADPGAMALVVALDTSRLGVERKATLDIYDPATGAKAKSLPLGHASQLRLAGVHAQLAVLRNSSRIVLVRLRDGKQVLLPLGAGACCKIVDAG